MGGFGHGVVWRYNDDGFDDCVMWPFGPWVPESRNGTVSFSVGGRVTFGREGQGRNGEGLGVSQWLLLCYCQEGREGDGNLTVSDPNFVRGLVLAGTCPLYTITHDVPETRTRSCPFQRYHLIQSIMSRRDFPEIRPLVAAIQRHRSNPT